MIYDPSHGNRAADSETMAQILNVLPGWVQGRTVRLRTYGLRQPASEPHPTMIVLPGFGRSVRDLAPWLQVAARAFAVTLIELPGQGGSEPPTVITLETLAAEVRAAIGGVTHDAALVVGESLGGLIALAIAADPPEKLAAVVAVDPPLTPANQPRFMAGIDELFRHLPQDAFLRAAAQSVFGIDANLTWTEAISHWRHLGETRVPTLILSGDIDVLDPRAFGTVPRMMDAAEIARLQAEAPAQVAMRVIADAGHKVLTDQPIAAREAVVSFLAKM